MTVRAPGARTCLCCLLVASLFVTVPARADVASLNAGVSQATDARTADRPDQGRRPSRTTATAPPDPETSAAPQPRQWWGWLLLGRLHPIVVHFPIALLTVTALIETLHLVRRKPVPSEAGTYCLAFGVAGAVASVWLGTLNAGHQSVTGEAAVALERHQVMGWISMIVAMTALGAGQVARRAGKFRTVAVYVGLVLATSAVVGATGHLGGGLVYGEDYLTGVLPWNQRAARLAEGSAAAPEASHEIADAQAPAGDAVDFTRDVMPILKQHCVECHGPEKVKARLRMDSVEGLQKGGKSGALVKPGDPENSLMLRRVLGLDGDDQMPLDKDPLSEKQIDTLRRWVAAGANYPAAGSQ
jgi:uncharacterized membrane protein